MQALRVKPLKLLGQGQPHRFRGNNAAVTGLMELQFDRYREVAGINRHSDTTNALATGPEEVAALIAQLRWKNAGLKISAAQRLAIFRDPAAAPALADNLRDESCEVRVAAALALATCGTRASVPPLLAALADAEPLVSQASAVALENLTGRGAAWDAFASADERQQQARSLGAEFQKPDWNQLEQGLIGRLSSGDRDVVRRSAVALGHVGGEAARSALRSHLARERENNPYPEWRKNHNGDGAMFNASSPANPRTLQAVTRSLGYLQDTGAVALLAGTVLRNSDPASGNLFLAEAAVEALGRIGTPAAEAALTNAFARLTAYPNHTRWYGDHDALIACHAAPVHYFIIEALDAMGSTRAGGIVPHLIRSVPTDPDRALLLRSDDYETLTGRVIRRSGAGPAVVETCLAILGDPAAQRTTEIAQAIATTHQAWGGKPDPENRAAQILSLTCRDRHYEPRIRAAFDRYRTRTNDIPRLFDTGIPVVTKLPVKHWVCFFLARSLGNLADPRSTDALMVALEKSPPEAALGYPDPLGPGVLFLHNDLTPCWRAATAWALGRIGDQQAVPVLLKTIGNLQNATDTRHAAAEALGGITDAVTLEKIRKMAADYPEVSTRRALLEISSRSNVRETSGIR
jgi:HEAT repeat protein